MASVTICVIDNNGFLDCIRSGDADSVMRAVEIEGKDFTMVAPPDILGGWRWVNNEWIADETAN